MDEGRIFYKVIKTDRNGGIVGVVPKVGYNNIQEALWHNWGVRLKKRIFKEKTTIIKRRSCNYVVDPLPHSMMCNQAKRAKAVKPKRVKTMPENDYSKMTHADFVRLLSAEMDKEGKPSALLSIPQIYEIVSEHYNNAVLEAWEQEQAGE